MWEKLKSEVILQTEMETKCLQEVVERVEVSNHRVKQRYETDPISVVQEADNLLHDRNGLGIEIKKDTHIKEQKRVRFSIPEVIEGNKTEPNSVINEADLEGFGKGVKKSILKKEQKRVIFSIPEVNQGEEIPYSEEHLRSENELTTLQCELQAEREKNKLLQEELEQERFKKVKQRADTLQCELQRTLTLQDLSESPSIWKRLRHFLGLRKPQRWKWKE